MNACHHYQEQLRSWLDAELPDPEQLRLQRHLLDCAACDAELERLRAVVRLTRAQEQEEPPPSFTANLHVRIASAQRGQRPWWQRVTPRMSPRRRWATAALAVTMVAAVYVSLLNTRISVAQIADRAAQAWTGINDYGCKFISTGLYQGQPRTFTQQQFFRRPGLFQLETTQDYRLTTFIDPNQVTYFLPGGEWRDQGPLAIVRPRTEGRDVLPFPFGVTWQDGGNVSIDQFIRQLQHTQNAELLADERVGEDLCYHLRFTAVPPGARRPDTYEMWIDKQRFLPLRVKWFHDAQNHIVTEVQQLKENIGVFPRGTFRYRPEKEHVVVLGDIDPHAFALPMQRLEVFDTNPVVAAANEMVDRARHVPFTPLAPGYLPEGYRLIRVRRSSGRWVDAHWIDDRDPQKALIIKLHQQMRAPDPLETAGGEELTLTVAGESRQARLALGTEPYRYFYLSIKVGNTRLMLFTAGLDREETLRIAQSLEPVPEAPIEAPDRIGPLSFASLLPADLPESDRLRKAKELAEDAASLPDITLDPLMMPFIPDEYAAEAP